MKRTCLGEVVGEVAVPLGELPAAALEHELAQGCLIKQHCGFARSTVLTAYCGMPVGAFKRLDITLLLGRIRFGIPIGPFPAKFFAENCAIRF